MKRFPLGVALVTSLVVLVVSAATLLSIYFAEHSYIVPLPGGTYKEGIVGSLASIHPLLSKNDSSAGDTTSLVFSGLTSFDPRQQKVVPDLATFETSKDYKTHTFYLNPKATWHDGVPVTADDVMFTYEMIAKDDFPNKTLQKSFTRVRIEKVNDSTVKFILDEPYVFFPTLTTLGIIPKHVWQDVAAGDLANAASSMKVVGSGPYTLDVDSTAVQEGDTILQLRRYDNYYGDIPYIEAIELHTFATNEDLLTKRNSVDAVYTSDMAVYDALKENERFQSYPSRSKQYYAAFFNLESDQLAKRKTRLGLGLAIDRNSVLNENEGFFAINTPFVTYNDNLWETAYELDKAKGALYDEGFRTPSAEEVEKKTRSLVWQAMSGTLIKEYGVPEVPAILPVSNENADVPQQGEPAQETNGNSNNPDNTNYSAPSENTNTNSAEPKPPSLEETFDLSKIELYSVTLDGARIIDTIQEYKTYRHDSKDNILEVHLVTLEAPEFLVSTAQYMKRQWEALGVKTTLDILSRDDAVEVIRKRQYDVVLIGQELGYDGDIFPYWHSSTAKLSGRNIANIKNATLDDLLLELRAPTIKGDDTVESALGKIKDKIERFFIDEMPALFFFGANDYYVVSKRIHNVFVGDLVLPRDRFVHINQWYIKEGKSAKGSISVNEFFSWLISKVSS